MREKTIYEKIAEKYNTTPEEVRREMQIGIFSSNAAGSSIYLSSVIFFLF